MANIQSNQCMRRWIHELRYQGYKGCSVQKKVTKDVEVQITNQNQILFMADSMECNTDKR